ncbi:hypothetical protein ACFFSY_13775 [Paenibacillus aurantiacus]|uniref:Uncharacterized protein n=1 Tax=Paenibacillus aurantiacus TaxID=1936118 RepID=A0ABV5KS98_9BACL
MAAKQRVTKMKEKAGNAAGETVLLFKVNQALSEDEHAILAERVRDEQERSGVKIVLVPQVVTAEVVTLGAVAEETPEATQGEEDNKQEPTADSSGDE